MLDISVEFLHQSCKGSYLPYYVQHVLYSLLLTQYQGYLGDEGSLGLQQSIGISIGISMSMMARKDVRIIAKSHSEVSP